MTVNGSDWLNGEKTILEGVAGGGIITFFWTADIEDLHVDIGYLENTFWSTASRYHWWFTKVKWIAWPDVPKVVVQLGMGDDWIDITCTCSKPEWIGEKFVKSTKQARRLTKHKQNRTDPHSTTASSPETLHWETNNKEKNKSRMRNGLVQRTCDIRNVWYGGLKPVTRDSSHNRLVRDGWSSRR